jgi:Predicted thiol oxidoreductase
MPATPPEAAAMKRRTAAVACALAMGLLPLALRGQTAQEGSASCRRTRQPRSWRELATAESAAFSLGNAVFNNRWSPANEPAGRRDGLGPVFNAPSCDACHNSRRRGRGPVNEGIAPTDLVLLLGVLQPGGSIRRGTADYGFVLNTPGDRRFQAGSIGNDPV